ncbi:SART-1 family protein DOT2 [Rosa chinensis]|nr:SART-1 family protein DOT2 [Rosa chinensis]
MESSQSRSQKSCKYRTRMNNSQLDENDCCDDGLVFSDDIDYHEERTRKLNILKKKEEIVSGVKSIALHAATAIPSGESSSPKVEISYMDTFVCGLQLDHHDEYSHNHKPQFLKQEADSEKLEAKDDADESELNEDGNRVVIKDEKKFPADGTIREAAIGKGLSGALNLLRDRRTLTEEEEGKKKRKLETTSHHHVAKPKRLHDYQEEDIRIERTDEFGGSLTEKEAYKRFCHTFHGKKSGARKQEKRIKKFQREQKLEKDTPSLFAERMKETQARLQTPYIVLRGK